MDWDGENLKRGKTPRGPDERTARFRAKEMTASASGGESIA
jgi:hypothetical protein